MIECCHREESHKQMSCWMEIWMDWSVLWISEEASKHVDDWLGSVGAMGLPKFLIRSLQSASLKVGGLVLCFSEEARSIGGESRVSIVGCVIWVGLVKWDFGREHWYGICDLGSICVWGANKDFGRCCGLKDLKRWYGILGQELGFCDSERRYVLKNDMD